MCVCAYMHHLWMCVPVFPCVSAEAKVSLCLFLPVGLAYINLVYDWVKASVMFGVINTVSRLDHLEPPQPPKCITKLYVFSET